MFRKAILAVPLALGACAGIPASTSSDATACLAALVAAGVSGGVAGIPAVALATPACLGLASDALAAIIAQAQTNATVSRRTMGLRP